MKGRDVVRDGSIIKRVFIQASPQTVYRALTDARALTRWFCDRVTSDPRIGGELVAFWRTGKSGTKGRAVYTRLVLHSTVELLWVDDGRGPDPAHAHHLLSYTIIQRKGACELIVEDRDDPPDEDTYAVLDDGWNSVLMELKDYCEHEERTAKLQTRRDG